MESQPQTALVGRELDLAVALEQLKRIEAGSPASMLVRGEAGIGKSRLVAELAARARQVGHRVLAGRADDLDRGIPYAVFRDVLARLGAGDTDDAVADLRATLDGTTGNDQLSAVFASAVACFRSLASGAPTVLVVEDLHVADRDSLALVALLVRLADLPMLTVASLRPGADGSTDVEHLLERMAFDGRGATVDLEPLDHHEIQALLAGVLGAVPDDDLTEAVFAGSQGNPFFAQEVGRSLLDGGAIAVDDGKARLRPEAPAVHLRPSTALLQRLFTGASSDVDLAKVMAVFGRFSLRHLELVQRLTARSADDVTRSFDRLVRAGLLAPTPDGGFEFTHALVRSALYEDIGPAERRRVHAAVAAELATERRAGFVLDVVELATHVAESAEPGDDAAAEILLDAGRAVAASAPLVSAEYHRRAAEVLPMASPRRGEAVAMQARALHIGSRPAEAAVVGLDALTGLPPGPLRTATMAIVANDLYLGCQVDEAVAVIDDHLALGGDPSPALAMKVNMLFQGGRRDEAAALFGRAREALAPSPSAALMAATHLVQYANHVGEVDIADAMLDRVVATCSDASPTVQLAVHELVAFADWRPGVAVRLDRELQAAQRLRGDAASLSIGGSIEAAHARRYLIGGQWDDALALIRTAGFDLEQRGVVSGAQLLLLAGCEVMIDRGAIGDAKAAAASFVTPIDALARQGALVQARLRRALDDRDGAEALLRAERERSTPGGSVWKLAEVLVELVEVLLDDGRPDEAAELADELESVAARTRWPESGLAARRARTLVDRDVDAARAYLALAEDERWEDERARALLLLGELDDDPAHHLVQAYKLFDGLGATPLRRRAAAGLRTRGLTVPRRRVESAALLTETEVELVRLVREGLSNRQIATALHYSPKTIEVYLSRVYTKTGCPSRLELIRAVDRGELDLGE